MPQNNAFCPAGTASIAVSTSTNQVAISGASATTTPPTVRILNDASVTVFMKFGTSSSVTAAVTDMPILAGTSETFTVPQGMTNMAAITAAGTGSVYITTGDGR